MAAPKGYRPPNAGKGRPKGSLNRSSGKAKEAIARFCEGNAKSVQGWLKKIAKDDGPLAAMDTYLKVLEYHLPKLGRTEHTGPDGGPVTLQLNKADDEL